MKLRETPIIHRVELTAEQLETIDLALKLSFESMVEAVKVYKDDAVYRRLFQALLCDARNIRNNLKDQCK